MNSWFPALWFVGSRTICSIYIFRYEIGFAVSKSYRFKRAPICGSARNFTFTGFWLVENGSNTICSDLGMVLNSADDTDSNDPKFWSLPPIWDFQPSDWSKIWVKDHHFNTYFCIRGQICNQWIIPIRMNPHLRLYQLFQFSSPLIGRKSGSWTIGQTSFFLDLTIT